jgi:WD40 repeat protein
MQSIKNTSAQIVNKTQNNNGHFNSKFQCTLQGHKDGIWDISCVPIPNSLFNNLASNCSHNLLIGTASADSTARLWYLNSQSSSTANNLSQLSPSQPNQCSQYLASNGFSIQQYCGHTGSVNSIRFHPRFFTDAINLILTASGDSQAHIWQCALSPNNDSFESTSEVVLNYNNCYSYLLNQTNNLQNQNNQLDTSSSVLSPSISTSAYHQQTQQQSPSSSTYINELFTNAPIIRSPIKRFEGHQDVCIAAEWFPEGDMIATASWDRTANVFNVETGKVLCNLQHDDYLTNVTIHPKHKIILTSSKDTTFKVWDFRDPICSVNIYQGHNRSVNSAIFVNEDKIATSSDDQTVKLWDMYVFFLYDRKKGHVSCILAMKKFQNFKFLSLDACRD